MTRGTTLAVVVASALAGLGATQGQSRPADAAARPRVQGILKPVGPPAQAPSRTEAGTGCIVDLVHEYDLSGTLSGRATIDYRIFVEGPCGSPPGTYPEQWIAHGEFTGTLGPDEAAADFTYLATVAAGGEIDGTVILGHGIRGELRVAGRFADRQLSYDGWAL